MRPVVGHVVPHFRKGRGDEVQDLDAAGHERHVVVLHHTRHVEMALLVDIRKERLGVGVGFRLAGLLVLVLHLAGVRVSAAGFAAAAGICESLRGGRLASRLEKGEGAETLF